MPRVARRPTPMTSPRPNGIRMSLSVFNSEDQVELLVRGIRELI